MSQSFHYNVQALGLLTASFTFGAGIFQVIAGVYSAKRGATKASLFGLAIIAVTSFAMVFSGDFYLQLLVRFITGVGAAFYFAPALVVISETLGENRSGLTLGLFNGAFSMGGALALFVFTPLASSAGWMWPFIITGILSAVAFVENSYAFKSVPAEVPIDYSKVKRTLRSRDIWAVVVGGIGLNATYYVVVQFLVSYSESYLKFSPTLAGTISSLVLVGSMIGAPIGGWIADRIRNRRLLVLIPAIAVPLLALLFVTSNPNAAWVAVISIGFFASIGFTNSFAFPSQLPEIGKKYAPLGVGLINSMDILVGGIYSTIFALIVVMFGYSSGWVSLVIATVAFGPFVYLSREPFSIREMKLDETKAI